MAVTSISINQGTTTAVATDTVGSVNYQIIKLDMGTAGTTNLFGGTSNPLPVTLASGIAGEDLVNNVLVTENRYSYRYIGTLGTTTIKTGSGFLHTVNFGGPVVGAGTIFDSAGTSGTVIFSHSADIGTAQPPLVFDVSFANGLTYGGVGTPRLTFSYR